jgi:signal transduction histidine kinase
MEREMQSLEVQVAAPVGATTPSSPRVTRIPPAHHHTVQFYENDHFLEAAVANYLVEGLDAGEAAVIIATPAHRDAFTLRLSARGCDPSALALSGRLVILDARETLSSFMMHALPNRTAFLENVGSVIDECARVVDGAPVRAFGEMVNLLWQDGNVEGAIQLEEFWNELRSSSNFSLLCAYALGNFYKGAHGEDFHRVCRAHSHVLPTEGYLELDETARLREVTSLQQRARALESEVEHRSELEQRLRIALAAKIQAEEQLRRALAEREVLLQRERTARAEAESASRAKSEFLAVMSHELRTPLNAIGGHVQLLEMGIHGSVVEAQRTALQRIERSQRHLLSLINDILNLTRIEGRRVEYAVEDVDLEPVLSDVKATILPLAAQHQFSIATDTSIRRIGARALIVRADRDKLQQILLNLLSNALKFTPAGGRITITTGLSTLRHQSAVVEVSDTGIGISPDKLEQIFQPFVQLSQRPEGRPQGIGLGLSISRELARGMGGDLTVSSDVGHGATFRLTLPLA